MQINRSFATLALAAVLLPLQAGCRPEASDEANAPIEMSGPPPALDDVPDHAHGEEHQGPHGGQLIELGRNHAYHAEIIEDASSHSVTVYILGNNLQELSVAQQEIQISLVVNNQPKAFSLQAEDGPSDQVSRFHSTDSTLFDALHATEVSGKLLVRIDGKSYSGSIESHDH